MEYKLTYNIKTRAELFFNLSVRRIVYTRTSYFIVCSSYYYDGAIQNITRTKYEISWGLVNLQVQCQKMIKILNAITRRAFRYML